MHPDCKPLRWGIIGCGKISTDFCIALSTLSKDEHVIEYVSAKDSKRAEDFALKFGTSKFTDKYANVFEDADVDVCYIGTLNTTHAELSITAMKHGKAVLCEKPATMSGKELSDVIACSEQYNVFYMEAVWTRCFPLYHDLLSKLNDGHLGEANVVLGTFGIENLVGVERINRLDLGGGALIDIGIYLLTVADMIFQGHKVIDVSISGHVSEENGLDQSGNITILLEGNKITSLLYSGAHSLPNQVKIMCSKGVVDVTKPFWCPESYTEQVTDSKAIVHEFKLPSPPMNMFFDNSMGLKFEAQHVRECLLEGRRESFLVSHEVSKRIIGWMDKLREQMKR